jgi:hypothetical protein
LIALEFDYRGACRCTETIDTDDTVDQSADMTRCGKVHHGAPPALRSRCATTEESPQLTCTKTELLSPVNDARLTASPGKRTFRDRNALVGTPPPIGHETGAGQPGVVCEGDMCGGMDKERRLAPSKQHAADTQDPSRGLALAKPEYRETRRYGSAQTPSKQKNFGAIPQFICSSPT